MCKSDVCVYYGEQLGRYGFGDGHPFGPDRLGAFWREFNQRQLPNQVTICAPVTASDDDLTLFHDHDYVAHLRALSATGAGFLDYGDTPAFKGIYQASCYVVGSVLDAVARLMNGTCHRAFVPIAGLHHARRAMAAGFCAVNDCGIAIEALRQRYDLTRIAYVDIDAHHGDGVFYAFEAAPQVIFADVHEDGRYLYPGTGQIGETGRDTAKGHKLNIPMPPGADDQSFFKVWPQVEEFLQGFQPEFIILQAGADSLAGDPITHLNYSAAAHHHATVKLGEIADCYCDGRFLALGGGGYNRNNIAAAWCAVVEAMLGLVPNTLSYPASAN